MNKLTSWKRIGSLLLTLAMVITMSVTTLPAYAAGGGSISVKYNPDVAGLESTNFKLHKVAGYGHDKNGKSIFVLEDAFKACEGVDLNSAKKDSEWLNEAAKLGSYAKNHDSSLKPVWSGALNKSDSYQSINGGASFDNGIYLLVGDEQQIGAQFWSPVPVLIQVFNGNSEFALDNAELKMTSRAVVHKHTVKKTWQDDSYKDGRPGSVKIAIYNGSTKVDTIEMSNDKGWVYTWYSYEGKDGWVYTSKDPSKADSKGVATAKLNKGNSFMLTYGSKNASWGAEEVAPAKYAADENYYVSNSPEAEASGNDLEIFNVINTVVIPAKHDPPVLKTVEGDEPEKDETFDFKLKAISTDANVAEMPMPEGSQGNIKTMKTKAGEEKEFGDIVFRVPGQYIYEISEVDTGLEGYKYDSTVYKLVYDLSVKEATPGSYELEMVLNTYKNGEKVDDVAEYEFVNEYTSPDEPDEPDKPGKPDKPDTGDHINAIVPATIFAGALIAFLIMFFKRRKQGKDQ